MSNGGPLWARPEIWGKKQLHGARVGPQVWQRGLGGLGRAQGGQAMLLVEQGVLWVLPMLWLVLLLSEAGAVLETGCSLEMGPGSRCPPRGRGEKHQGETRLRVASSGHGSSPRDLPAPMHKPSWIAPQQAPEPPGWRWAWGTMVAPGAGGRAGGRAGPRAVEGTLGSHGHPDQHYSPVALPGGPYG